MFTINIKKFITNDVKYDKKSSKKMSKKTLKKSSNKLRKIQIIAKVANLVTLNALLKGRAFLFCMFSYVFHSWASQIKNKPTF